MLSLDAGWGRVGGVGKKAYMFHFNIMDHEVDDVQDELLSRLDGHVLAEEGGAVLEQRKVGLAECVEVDLRQREGEREHRDMDIYV